MGKLTSFPFLFWQFLGLLLLFFFSIPHQPFESETLVDRFNSILTEWKFSLRGSEIPSGNVVIVAIDEASLQKKAIGKWPWKRRYQAALIDSIFQSGARNVGLDIVLEDRYLADQEDDQIFAAVLSKYRDAITLAWVAQCIGDICKQSPNSASEGVIGTPISKSELRTIPYFSNSIYNDPLFSQIVTSQGFLNSSKTGRGKIERVIYYLRNDTEIYPSMPLALASQRQGKRPLEIVNQSSSPINFLGPSKSIPTYSALCFFSPNDIDGCPKDPRFLQGKTVILGVTALAVGDQVSTAFDAVADGVEVQATVVDRILTGQMPRDLGWGLWGILCLISLLLFWFFRKLDTRLLIFSSLLILVLFALVDYGCFSQHVFLASGLFYLSCTYLSLSSLGRLFYQETQQKRFLKDAFSKYLSPEVIKSLLQNRRALSLGGEKKEITILFCDVRNFTSISETLDPTTLTRLLNDILTALTRVLFKHQGTVDKYIGDAVMAFFGAPLNQPDHAHRACLAAQEMVREIKQRKAFYLKEFGVEIKIGIGINTGTAYVGNMGSDQRFNYSVVGDSVNLASRVESCTKDLQVSILTTAASLNSIKTTGAPVPNHRSVGEMLLKGKSEPVELFEIVEV